MFVVRASARIPLMVSPACCRRGMRPRRFWDVDPRKRVARGVPVTPAAELGAPDGALILCAVGAAGAREDIRAELAPRGFREGRDFLFVA